MRALLLPVVLFFLFAASPATAQRLEVPRRHDRPPGPPISAQQAVARMTVPDGFSVEVVAAEPDIANPVAMSIDERGRIWITESFEYPRRSAGPGRDRVKVLEDTTGDGRADSVTVFADGLNIPSGIAVGHGGVWVANAPDLLFMQDTDGDGKADVTKTVLTGFGRTDTHELPNSLTWGPDGWLYGLNGVFNHSHVKYGSDNPNRDAEHPGWKFTCAMFRIHPRTWEFQVFAEGTSNPWGIAINDEGDFFISACVIDHLWHIVESGYYIRQGGPYPANTWPMRSIVDHKHQKAAYCGITWSDTDAWPEEYRKLLLMGNIHGGCINADVIERHGSTYRGRPHPGFAPKNGAWDDDEYGTIRKRGDDDAPKLADFLTANDAWFMPVVQKTGPDGCLYVLDWYDRYHCYQDANADPEGIDRAKGRLYRVIYDKAGRLPVLDLSTMGNDELADHLDGRDEYVRATARRLLAERLSEDSPVVQRLIAQANDTSRDVSSRLRAMWALAGADLPPSVLVHNIHYDVDHPQISAWKIRLLADRLDEKLAAQEIAAGLIFGQDEDPRVFQQRVIAASKLYRHVSDRPERFDSQLASILLYHLALSENDPTMAPLVWQNLLPIVSRDPDAVGQALVEQMFDRPPAFASVLPRAVSVLADDPRTDGNTLSELLEETLVEELLDEATKRQCLDAVAERLRQRSLTDEQRESISGLFLDESRLADADEVLDAPLTVVRALLGSGPALDTLRHSFADSDHRPQNRLAALETLIAAGDAEFLDRVEEVLADAEAGHDFRAAVIESLGRSRSPKVAGILLVRFDDFEPAVQPKAIEVLTQRPGWSLALLDAIQNKKIDRNLLNVNQLRRLATFTDEPLKTALAKVYGQIRLDGRSDRQQVIRQHRDLLRRVPGDARAGVAVFKKICAQCHKMYGDGAEVGPDITRNGRNNWEQLLSNVFDPSLVIGPGYQARQLLTDDGRVLTGLPVEENERRVILKIQGGKLETIPREEIEEYRVSNVSMMPEGIEKQLTPQELADLFAYLALDGPPDDPKAKLLPGAPAPARGD
ncbi:Cytochrome c [Maioricimonas rarisocia]|uniref:Cytochrome c n=1 Tax=Maioricimonas rarisocia TaxID=2528026 RepID=A0A517Z693_9PLAN|nr:PVC-type heme-binding CxxCH protein [Maioricimonas rarisocia]QDU37984.1 Cytochrome c [Maioricimonas rarisocia]